jgi:phage-related protein
MKQLTVSSGVGDFTFYDNQNNIILNKFEGFEFSSFKSIFDEVASNGAIYTGAKFGKRRLAWSGDILGSDVYTLRRQMLAVLTQNKTIKTLKFTTYDDINLQCEAEIVKVLFPYTHQIHSYLIEAVAPDWRFYSQTLQSVDITASETVNNAGNEQTMPIFKIYGAGEGFTITNTTTGESFELSTVLDSDDYITVDCKEKTVIKNGTSNIYKDFSGEFFSIVSGDNDLEFAIDSDDDENTKLNVTFRSAYRGV